jgi:cytochrome c oxidase assembly protein subunit 15
VDVLTRSALAKPLHGPAALRRWSVAALVSNIVIVVTGALVRLTDSGLGCPTWPKCSATSYVAHPALGYHGAIEFGNRLLTFVLALIAVLTWLAARWYRQDGAPRRDLRRLTTGIALGIPVQAVIGGISVLARLNPFIVAIHLLVSFLLIALAVLLVRRSNGRRAIAVDAPALVLARVAFALMWVTVWLGTVVTGSGPHAGDQQAVRTGFDPELVTQLHTAAVYTTAAVTVGCLIFVRSAAAWALLAVEVVQGTIGFLQYFNGLPIGLVALHLLGAATAIALATNLVLSVRRVETATRAANAAGSPRGSTTRWPSRV